MSHTVATTWRMMLCFIYGRKTEQDGGGELCQVYDFRQRDSLVNIMGTFHLNGKVGITSIASFAVNGKRVAASDFGNVNKRCRVFQRHCLRGDVKGKRPYTNIMMSQVFMSTSSSLYKN